MIIQTNVSAIRAHNGIRQSSVKGDNAAQRLSSGLRINKAADDAAGLAISEKMRAQVRGFEQAERNIEDAKNLFQTGDGGLSEINSMLIRARELAIQAANDTNTDEDRRQLDLECQELFEALDLVVDITEFNEKKILKSGVKTTEIIETVETVTLKNLFMSSFSLDELKGKLISAPSGETNPHLITDLKTTVGDVSLFYITDVATGSQIGATIEKDFGALLKGAYSGSGTFDDFVNNMYLNNPLTESDKEIFLNTFQEAFNNVFSGITHNGQSLTAVAAYDADGHLGVGFLNRDDIKINFGGCYGAKYNSWGHGFLHSVFKSTDNVADVDITTITKQEIETWPKKELWVQSGADEGQGVLFEWKAVSVDELGLENTKLDPIKAALKALKELDDAMEYVLGIRAKFGAFINRLDASRESVATTALNLHASLSRIRDADMAKESMDYLKSNVLQQAGITMLTQANQSPEKVLELLQ